MLPVVIGIVVDDSLNASTNLQLPAKARNVRCVDVRGACVSEIVTVCGLLRRIAHGGFKFRAQLKL